MVILSLLLTDALVAEQGQETQEGEEITVGDKDVQGDGIYRLKNLFLRLSIADDGIHQKRSDQNSTCRVDLVENHNHVHPIYNELAFCRETQPFLFQPFLFE